MPHLFFTVILIATTCRLGAEEAGTTERAVGRLFAAYFSGDTGEIEQLWPAKNESRETFLSGATIVSLARCSDIEGLRVVEQAPEGDAARVVVVELAVRQTLIRTGRMLPLVIARWRVTLQQRAGRWQVDDAEPWASFFVAKLASSAAKERQTLLRDYAAWIDDSVVDALVRKARERELETDYESARALTGIAYAAAIDLRSTAAEARARAQQARLTYDAGNSTLAILEATHACELAELSGDPDAQVFTDTDLGRLYLAMGRYSLALPIIVRALALKDQTIEMMMISRVYGQLFEIHSFDSDVAAAVKTLREFERTARLARDPWGAFNVQFSLSALYFSGGDMKLALRAAREGLEVAKSKHASQLVAAGLAEEARILERAMDYRAALAILEEARKLAVSTGNRADEHRSEMVAASIHLKMEPPPSDEEIEHIRDVARSESAHVGFFLELLAALRMRQKRYQEASETLREAERWYEERAATAPAKADVLALEARLARLKGQAAEGVTLLRRSIAARESAPPTGNEREQRLAFRRAAVAHQQLAVMLIEQRQPLEAFLAVEHGRSRTLLALLEHAQKSLPVDLTNDERAGVTRLEDRISELNRQLADRGGERDSVLQKLDEARADLEAVRTRLFLDHPSPEDHALGPEMTAADLATLPAGVTFVEYVEAFDEVYALVLRNGSGGIELTATKLPASQEAVAAMAATFGGQVAQRSVVSAVTSRKAFDILITPIETQLRGSSSLCIVPTGALWNVPFAALKDRRGHLLVERHATFYDPAVTVFLHLFRRPRQVNPMTLL
ncbi:MAG: CHAT domain-containing protein, partial [Thermoanaerobaculia bacterium]